MGRRPAPVAASPTVRNGRCRGADHQDEEPEQQHVATEDARRAEEIEVDRVCDRPSKRIEPTPERDEGHVGPRPTGLQQADCRMSVGGYVPPHPPARTGRAGPSSRNQTVKVSPLRRHGVAPELGHHRQREGGVPDGHDEQRWRSRRRPTTSSSQMKDGEPDRRRPAAQRFRVLGGVPATDAEAAEGRRTQVMQGRERVQPMPDRPEERGQDRDADPAIDPQEQGRDVPRARSASNALGHDPCPPKETDRPEPRRMPRRGNVPGPCRRRLGANVGVITKMNERATVVAAPTR